MSFGIVLEICAAAYTVAILIELFIVRRWLRFALEMVALLIAVALALLLNNAMNGHVSFGEGASPVGTVGIMFLATIFGIAARFIFYLQKRRFHWLDFFKPISISPIVLLPLIGSVQTTGELHGMQVISFAVLAFQNGFFWQAVLGGAQPITQTSETSKDSSHVRANPS